MAVYEFEGKRPKLGQDCYIYEEATIIGDVTLGDNCYVGAGAVIRGDYGSVKIGSRTAVEENCIVHARPDDVCTVGNDVTVGHGAILHNCTLDDWCVIGMGAIVSDWARVGRWERLCRTWPGSGKPTSQAGDLRVFPLMLLIGARTCWPVIPWWFFVTSIP